MNFIRRLNWLEYIFFVLFFCVLLHRLAARISLPFYDFLQVIIALNQVYNWETQHHSTFCRCGLAGILFYPWFKFYFPLFQTHYHTLS